MAIEVCPSVKARFPLKPTRENQRKMFISASFPPRGSWGCQWKTRALHWTTPLRCFWVSKPGYSRAPNQSGAGPDQFLPVASLSLRCSSGRTPGPLQEGSSTATATRSRENLSHGAGRPAAYQAEEAQRRQQEGAIAFVTEMLSASLENVFFLFFSFFIVQQGGCSFVSITNSGKGKP